MRFVPQLFLESVARAVNMCRRQHEKFLDQRLRGDGFLAYSIARKTLVHMFDEAEVVYKEIIEEQGQRKRQTRYQQELKI